MIPKLSFDKPIFGCPDQGTLKTTCPDPRMSFSGIPNRQHFGGLLAFCHARYSFVALLSFIVQSEKTCFVFHLQYCVTINNKKYLNHATLSLQRANTPDVYETNCNETHDNLHAALQASRVLILIAT